MTLLSSASLLNVAIVGRPSASKLLNEAVAEVCVLLDVNAPGSLRSSGVRAETATAVDVPTTGTTHAVSRAEFATIVAGCDAVGQNLPPVWGSPAGTVFNLKQGDSLPLAFASRFVDPNGDPMTFTQITGSLPAGVTFNVVTGALDCDIAAPTGAGTEDIVFRADDGQQTILNVGPGKPYTTVRAALLVAQSGNVIQIDPGDYIGDVGTLAANNVTIRGTSAVSRARLFANGVSQSGKGIIVLDGDNCTFENMEFHECSVVDNNGAGVRHDGAGLTTFRNCGFYDNENGILSGGGGEVLMEFCEFARNGFGDGFSHNVYLGLHSKVTARDCYFHQAKVGHEFKTRAKETVLERCYFVNGPTGNASYLINADSGGSLVMRGCMLQKSTNAGNSNTIFHNSNVWGAGFNSILLEHCTLVHQYPTGSFINLASGTTAVTLRACLFASNGRPLVTGATPTVASNFHTTVSNLPNASNLANPDFWPSEVIHPQLDLPSALVPTYLSDEPSILTKRDYLTPPTVIGAIQNALAAVAVDYWFLPTLQDEMDFYANPNKTGGVWDWTSVDRDFNFASSPNPLPTFAQTGSGKLDVHGDFENDDLWTWQAHVLRGYADPALISNATQRLIPTLWRDRWLQFYRDSYLNFYLKVNDTFGDSSANSGHYCHTFVAGLCWYSKSYNDAATQAAAEAIGDWVWQEFTTGLWQNSFYGLPARGTPVGPAHERVFGRVGVTFCHLVELTNGLAKWVTRRDAYIERFMQATDWMEAPAMGMLPGTGFYHSGGADAGHNFSQADYDAGKRMCITFYSGVHAEFLWRAYLQTARADVLDRLIKLGRFHQLYGFQPEHTIPQTGTTFGHWNGAIWHPQADGDAWSGYTFSIVNSQVWAYKLTGDVTLLDQAKYTFRQCSKFEDRYPISYGPPYPTLGTGHHVPDNEVWSFIDVDATSSSAFKYFEWNKGALTKCYQLFENGGNPTVIV